MFRSFIYALICLVLLVAPACAADDWVASDVRGSVLALVNGEWQELSSGDLVNSGIPIRTLQAGRVMLRRGDEALQLAPNTTIRPMLNGSTATIQQYAGTLTLAEPRGASRLLAAGYIAQARGTIVASVNGQNATFSVRSGQVQLSSRSGRVLLKEGQVFPVIPIKAGSGSSVSGAPDTSITTTPVNTAGSSSGTTGSSGKTDSGKGNGGTPGNGGQNGNAGGKGNGNGHSQ